MNPGGQVSVQLEPFQTLDLSPGQPASGGAVNSGEEGAQPWAEQLLETLKSPNGPPDGQGSVDSGLVSVDGGLSTASVLSATSNSSAFSSGLHALSVSSPSFSPQRPLIFVPGFGGSFAADSAVGEWLTTRGLSPDKLQLDPLANTYGDLVRTLETAGYVLDQTLFVANWDWRLAVAPSDGIADGNISGLSASTLTDNEFTYGVDYLSNAMKQAVDRWKDQHGGTAPDSVDIVSHSTGGLIARAYIESGAYPLSTDLNPVLRKCMISSCMASPNQGSAQVWNILNDNWGYSAETRLVSFVANAAFERVKNGETITGPDNSITLASITTNNVADPKKFILQYAPSLKDLLPTFDFINTGSASLTNLNTDSVYANKFLLDLNGGADSNAFIDRLTVDGKLVVFYSSDQNTLSSTNQLTGGTGLIVDLANPLGRAPAATEVWYQDQAPANSGDGTVLTLSAFGQFQSDTPRITAGKISGTLETGVHASLPSNPAANTTLLNELGIADTTGLISTGEQYTTPQKFGQAIKFGFLFLTQDSRAASAATSTFSQGTDILKGMADGNFSSLPNFDIPNLSFSLPSVSLSGLIEVTNPALTISGAGYHSGAFSGAISLSASSATLFPGKSLTASVTDGSDSDSVGLSGSLDLAARTFTFTADEFSISAGGDVNVLSVIGSGLSLSINLPTLSNSWS